MVSYRSYRSILAALILAAITSAPVQGIKGIRSAFLDFVGDPFVVGDEGATRFLNDGLLVIGDDGIIKDYGTYKTLRNKYPTLRITRYPQHVITPGMFDTHVHYSQSRVTAGGGLTKDDWLENYIFQSESELKNATLARSVAKWFLQQALRSGTTTMQSFTTVYKDSADVFFDEASKLNMRVIAGVTGMDVSLPNATEKVRDYNDTAQQFYDDSLSLYKKWHGVGRNLYAVTPRFAPGATDAMLAKAGHLYQTLPGVYMNTHLAEILEDAKIVQERFPNTSDYLNVFEGHGLVGPRCTFGHSIHLDDSSYTRIAKAGANCAHCPVSNTFLGSGLFNITKAKIVNKAMVSLGTDMAGGNTFSIADVMNEAYKVAMLNNYYDFTAYKGFYLATLGSAKALYLDDKLGSFDIGKEADFVVWDPVGTRQLKMRNVDGTLKNNVTGPLTRSWKLFGLMSMGGDQAVKATYVMGKRLY